MVVCISRLLRKRFGEIVPVLGCRGTLESQKIFKDIMKSSVDGGYLTSLCSKLPPLIVGGNFTVLEEVKILERLSEVSLRHEAVITSCLWDIFKAPYANENGEASEFNEGTVSALHLGEYTAFAFRVMAEQRFINDPQLITLAIGRCVELVAHLSFHGVSEVYRGLYALQLQHFTISEVPLGDRGGLLKPGQPHLVDNSDYDSGIVELPTSSELIHQPNLIDVLSSSLEQQLRRFVEVMNSEKNDSRDSLDSFHRSSGENEENRRLMRSKLSLKRGRQLPFFQCRDVLFILKGLSFLGVQHEGTFFELERISQMTYKPTIKFYSLVLYYATRVDLRAIDVLNYTERSAAFLESRDYFQKALCFLVLAHKNLQTELRRDLCSVLRLRKLFEACPELWHQGARLWDIVRLIPVTHKKALALSSSVADIESSFATHSLSSQQNHVIRQGRLFNPQYTVKVKKLSKDFNEAEKLIPPQFKTWNNPLSERARRHGPREKRVKFGVQRITKNYIRDKRKKFCPSVRVGSSGR